MWHDSTWTHGPEDSPARILQVESCPGILGSFDLRHTLMGGLDVRWGHEIDVTSPFENAELILSRNDASGGGCRRGPTFHAWNVRGRRPMRGIGRLE